MRKGTKVRVKGLVKAPEHNGKVGVVTDSAAKDARVAVKLDVDGKMLAVRAENLEVFIMMDKSSETSTSRGANAWREVLPVVNGTFASQGDHSLASLCLEKVASSSKNINEFNEIVKSDETETMDQLVKKRRIVPEVRIWSEDPLAWFIPCAAYVDVDSDGRYVATILCSNPSTPGTVQCTFNADATKCCYTEFSPFNVDRDRLDAMVKEESERIFGDDDDEDRFAEGVSTHENSLWVRTGGCVQVSEGFLVTLHQNNLPSIKPLISDVDEFRKHSRIIFPSVIMEDSTYAVLEPCEIIPDDDDPSTWGCGGTQPYPVLFRVDLLTGNYDTYCFKRSEEIDQALDFKDYLDAYHSKFPVKYRVNSIEIIKDTRGEPCIIMSICAWCWGENTTFIYQGVLKEEDSFMGCIIVWTCVCRTPSLIDPSSASCKKTGAVAITSFRSDGIAAGDSVGFDPKKHNYTEYALVLSALKKSAPGWSAPLQRLPTFLQSWKMRGATLAFSTDGKKLFAFGYDIGVPMAEYDAHEKKFIEAEFRRQFGEDQKGGDKISGKEKRQILDLWAGIDDESKHFKMKAYCRDV